MTPTNEKLMPELRFKGFDGEWERKRIDEIFSTSRGDVIAKKTLKQNKDNINQYPVYSSQTTNKGILGYKDEYMYEGTFLTWTTDGANAGEVFLREGKFNCTNVCGLLTEKDNYKGYANKIIREILRKETPKHVSYVGNPKLMNNIMKTIFIIIPTSLPEQKKIASFFTSLDKEIEILEKKIDLLKKEKKGFMQRIFDRELRFKDENGEAFGEWENKYLKDIGFFKTSSVNKKTKENEKIINLLNYMDVYNHKDINNQNTSKLMKVSANQNQLKKNTLKKGDILFTPSSETPEDIGHSIVIPEDLDNTLYSYHLLRFRPNIELDISYSHYFCNIPKVRNQIIRFATGTTRFTVGLKEFGDINVNIPSLPEQKKIASFFTTLDKNIEKHEKELEMKKELKKAFMQRMFV